MHLDILTLVTADSVVTKEPKKASFTQRVIVIFFTLLMLFSLITKIFMLTIYLKSPLIVV